uniref:RING-type domain-containing protein n=1 Tax=Glossina brevipalpis TaxID=37001 RepID=A0A1A9WHL2_9MUSC
MNHSATPSLRACKCRQSRAWRLRWLKENNHIREKGRRECEYSSFVCDNGNIIPENSAISGHRVGETVHIGDQCQRALYSCDSLNLSPDNFRISKNLNTEHFNVSGDSNLSYGKSAFIERSCSQHHPISPNPRHVNKNHEPIIVYSSTNNTNNTFIKEARGLHHPAKIAVDHVDMSPTISPVVATLFVHYPDVVDSINKDPQNSIFATYPWAKRNAYSSLGNQAHCKANINNIVNRTNESCIVTTEASSQHQSVQLFRDREYAAPEICEMNARSVDRENFVKFSSEKTALIREGRGLKSSTHIHDTMNENMALTKENLDQHYPAPTILGCVNRSEISRAVAHSSVDNLNIADSVKKDLQESVFVKDPWGNGKLSSLLRNHGPYNMNIDKGTNHNIETLRSRHQSVQAFCSPVNATPEVFQVNAPSFMSNSSIDYSANFSSENSVLTEDAGQLSGLQHLHQNHVNRSHSIFQIAAPSMKNANAIDSVNRNQQSSVFAEDSWAKCTHPPDHAPRNMKAKTRMNGTIENSSVAEEAWSQHPPITLVFDNGNQNIGKVPPMYAANQLQAYHGDVNIVAETFPIAVNSFRKNRNVESFVDRISESNAYRGVNLLPSSGRNKSPITFSYNSPWCRVSPITTHVLGEDMPIDCNNGGNDHTLNSENGFSAISPPNHSWFSLSTGFSRENVNVYDHEKWANTNNGYIDSENGVSEISPTNAASANHFRGDHANRTTENSAHNAYGEDPWWQWEHSIFGHVNRFSEINSDRANAYNKNDSENNLRTEHARKQHQEDSFTQNHLREYSENFSFSQRRHEEISNVSNGQNWIYGNAEESLSSFSGRNMAAESCTVHPLFENVHAPIENHRFLGQQVDSKTMLPCDRSNSYATPMEQPSCVICLDDFKLYDNVRVLACYHIFHTNCFNPWLKRNPTCPLCRMHVER